MKIASISHNLFLLLEWLQRAREQTLKKKDKVNFDATGQLAKTTWILAVFQITLLILFATVGGERIV